MRKAATNPQAGALVWFEGTVRNHHQGRSVLKLAYEAHAVVAENEGRKIVAEAEDRFGLEYAAAEHRIGPLEIGESAVIVVAVSAHRAEAFEACRYMIDEIKRRVPIWKKEFYQDGSADWVGCEGCAGHADPPAVATD